MAAKNDHYYFIKFLLWAFFLMYYFNNFIQIAADLLSAFRWLISALAWRCGPVLFLLIVLVSTYPSYTAGGLFVPKLASKWGSLGRREEEGEGKMTRWEKQKVRWGRGENKEERRLKGWSEKTRLADGWEEAGSPSRCMLLYKQSI